jgi:NAD(P)-dependent dehydrogenase (short-subunit alcohol dehydrogenase family)
VLVTGAARGIGRAVVEAFAASEWRVVAGVREPAGAGEFSGGDVHLVPLDVRDSDAVHAAVAAGEGLAGGALDCVVNNAGWALFGAVEDVDLDLAREEFETNVFGAVAVLQAALPAMRRAGRGVVVSVSTLAGRIPLPLFGMYSASKLALAGLCEALALEVAPDGIRVVLLEAGVVRTEFARSTRISGSVGIPESTYGTARDRVLGALRSIREEAGLEAEDVASAIRDAVDDDEAPFRVVLPDARLRPLGEAMGDEEGRLEHVRRFLDLGGPPSRGTPR